MCPEDVTQQHSGEILGHTAPRALTVWGLHNLGLIYYHQVWVKYLGIDKTSIF